jgi:hypothetical protein
MYDNQRNRKALFFQFQLIFSGITKYHQWSKFEPVHKETKSILWLK